MKKLFAVIAASLALFATGAFAQQIKVATGDPKGTYSTMIKQANQVCSNTTPLIEQNTNGSIANIDLLAGNKVNAGVVQTDVLYFNSKTQDLSAIKTLVALHPEQVHVIVRNADLKTGGYLGGLVGAKSFAVKTVADLAGRKVGAVGGSVISAKVVSSQGGLNLNVIDYPSNDEALKALAGGDVDGVIAVGGQPLAVVANLNKNFKLAAFPDALVSKLGAVYSPGKVSYPNIDAAGVVTVQTDALLVTRDYKSASMSAALKAVRQCLYDHIVDLQETTGTHPAWQKVSAENKGKWAVYQPK